MTTRTFSLNSEAFGENLGGIFHRHYIRFGITCSSALHATQHYMRIDITYIIYDVKHPHNLTDIYFVVHVLFIRRVTMWKILHFKHLCDMYTFVMCIRDTRFKSEQHNQNNEVLRDIKSYNCKYTVNQFWSGHYKSRK